MHVTESKLGPGGGKFQVLVRLLNYIDVSPEEMIPTVKSLVSKIFDAYEVKKICSFFFGKLYKGAQVSEKNIKGRFFC